MTLIKNIISLQEELLKTVGKVKIKLNKKNNQLIEKIIFLQKAIKEKEIEMNKKNNQLALEILMPEKAFRDFWEKAQSIKEVADKFEVGEHHAALRGYQLCGEMFL